MLMMLTPLVCPAAALRQVSLSSVDIGDALENASARRGMQRDCVGRNKSKRMPRQPKVTIFSASITWNITQTQGTPMTRAEEDSN